ncbi:flagellar filament capping protein FliD [Vibrio ulleungensis]|uniref:Flagellar hook-associated protein 2 n=1 Tax=Vibrio ulleungensis TaxID=2807619 RepID=A0ABS2HJI9_9VIBR|nr:flagellar filament capping protein FliD [Vibrio ulleungensis]MBM7036338.1 flagellar filament capping protein FliD [Vibrio ulleungensis]
MSLSPLGMSGGMDINSMVTKIVDSERIPKQQRIDNERADIQSDLSAYGKLRESLDSMRYMMSSFRMDKAFALRSVESNNEAVVSATASTEAIAGRYSVDVLQLAQSHKLASHPVEDKTRFGPGKLQIELGDRDFDIEVKPNSKVVDVVRSINHAKTNPGVRASVINDSQGQRLIISSDKSGEKNSLSVAVDASPDSALQQFNFQSLEQRVKRLEDAQTQSVEALNQTVLGQEIASYGNYHQRNLEKIDELKQQLAQMDAEHQQKMQAIAEANPLNPNDQTIYGDAAGSKEAQQYAAYKPGTGLDKEDIPGWNASTAGVLNDSYEMRKPELDPAAIKKKNDVPGWTNSASGTLTHSYESAQERQAKAKERERLETIERTEHQKAKAEAINQFLEQSSADSGELAKLERSVLAKAIDDGIVTQQQAELEGVDALPEEELQKLNSIKETQDSLLNALQSVENYDGLAQVSQAQDSKVTLDGIAQLSSETNVIEDAVDGISLTLKGVSEPGDMPSDINVEYDVQGVVSRIEQFVQAYNQFDATVRELSNVDPVSGQKGALAGDSVVRNATSKIKAVISSPIEGAPENLKSLTEFGITSTREGPLEINYKMLEKQVAGNFTQLNEFFTGSNGFARKLEDAVATMTGVTGGIRTRESSLVDQNYRLRDQQDNLDRRMSALQERTHNKFASMQDATSKMQGQLAGMMNALG